MKSNSDKTDEKYANSLSRITNTSGEKTKRSIPAPTHQKWSSNAFESAARSPQPVFSIPFNETNRNSFRVLTYNLWCHRLVGGWRSSQRLNTFSAWLLNDSTPFYDIICLQEVFTCNPLLLLNYDIIHSIFIALPLARSRSCVQRLIGNFRIIANLLGVVVALMGIAFLAVAFNSDIRGTEIVSNVFIPQIPEGSLLLIIGLIGTTIVPYNLFLASGMVEIAI